MKIEMKILLAEYNSGNLESGYNLCLESGSVHAREEYAEAWDNGDQWQMDAAVSFALEYAELQG